MTVCKSVPCFLGPPLIATPTLEPIVWLSAVWMFGLLVAFLAILWRKPILRPPAHAFGLLLALALALRLTPSILLRNQGNFDIESFRLVGEVLNRGEDVYTQTDTHNRYPYLPLQMFWAAAAARLAGRAGMPFPFAVRLLPIGVDALIPLLLFALARKRDSARAWRAGLLYAFNPVSVFVSACHGQFDALPATLALLALVDIPARRGALWLGAGILDKSWPVLAWPLWGARLRTWRERLLCTAVAASIPLAFVVFYARARHTSVAMVFKRALTYNWGVGVWGYSYFVRMGLMALPGWPATFGWCLRVARFLTLGMLAWVWIKRARRSSPVEGFLTILLAFLAWGHAFSVQYLLWPLPLAILEGEERYLGRYVLASFAYMFLAYYTLIFRNSIVNLLPWPQADWFLIMPAGIPAWLVTVFWLRERWRGVAKTD